LSTKEEGKKASENLEQLSLSHISANQGNFIDKMDSKNGHNFFVHY